MAEPKSPQQRLDRIVQMIAANLVAEVCSIYALQSSEVLELMATQGLASEAVHRTRMHLGEGLVGTIAATGDTISTDDAQGHPNFVFFPETGEDSYRSFLGVPILRGGRIIGVLVVQNMAAKRYDEDDVEALEIIASVLAEMFASSDLLRERRFAAAPTLVRDARRFEGLRLVEGIAIGRAWPHAPRVPIGRLLADNIFDEVERLQRAVEAMRRSFDTMLDDSDLGVGEHRDVLETYRMFAHDRGWIRRIREVIEGGLSAEAAVRRIQDETQMRLEHASDPYLRERLLDTEDMTNRLLMHLAGRDLQAEAKALPENSILVARNLSAADLIEYDRAKVAGIVLEEGSGTAHVTVVARAFGLPVVGRVGRILAEVAPGDLVALDGENGQVFLNPSEDVVDAFHRVLKARRRRRQELAGLRDAPAVTLEGTPIGLRINAAFLLDLPELDTLNAEGVGLYRTELTFMTRADFPTCGVQTEYYRQVMARAGGRPVVFRTLDVGSDKQLPYWRMPAEENPAMGWRALRMALDRPTILRTQLRAFIEAAGGGRLHLMFPMVAEVAELRAAKRLLGIELRQAEARGLPLPADLQVGVMMEVPSLYWQMDALLAEVDFVSIGSNDLFQFLFACDRGSPALAERYDVLSPPALSFFRELIRRCDAAGVRVALCGEMASRPLEAMALVGLGLRNLSLSAAQFGDVKAMVRSLDAAALGGYLKGLLHLPDHSLRRRLVAYAYDHGIVLPASTYGGKGA
ncbi:MAG: phosphoenolpyruvate--protein phosphotransferase [Geminicoccaceae bacterium]|nr:phosphoenolpyruvate--protein phosphotransferase [Geminicoccaceae bacterium]